MDEVVIERVTAPTAEVAALIGELEAVLAAEYPPEQRHGLALDAIFVPEIRFYVARVAGAAVGCGGVAIAGDAAELKRMYVRPAARGRGVADRVLARLEADARAAGCAWLRLETGTRQDRAVRFYARAGFAPSPAFGDYAALPAAAIAGSLFFAKRLAPGA